MTVCPFAPPLWCLSPRRGQRLAVRRISVASWTIGRHGGGRGAEGRGSDAFAVREGVSLRTPNAAAGRRRPPPLPTRLPRMARRLQIASAFPADLSGSQHPRDHAQLPGAVAMSVKIADDEFPTDVFAELVAAENLQRLSVKSFHPWIDVPAATAYFPELTHLRQLSLSWWNEDGCPTVYTSLNCFTNLTSLQIRSSIEETDAFDFLRDLQRLKELRLHLSICLEPDEEISLPPMTHITHLDVNIERWSHTGAWKTLEVTAPRRPFSCLDLPS